MSSGEPVEQLSKVEPPWEKKGTEFRVRGESTVVEVSDKLYHHIKREGPQGVTVTAGGEHAVNQMSKALATTRARLMVHGIRIAWYMHYVDRPGERDGKMITFLKVCIIESQE